MHLTPELQFAILTHGVVTGSSAHPYRSGQVLTLYWRAIINDGEIVVAVGMEHIVGGGTKQVNRMHAWMRAQLGDDTFKGLLDPQQRCPWQASHDDLWSVENPHCATTTIIA